MPLSTPRDFDDRGREVIYLDPMFHGSHIDRATRERVNQQSDSRQQWLLVLTLALAISQVLRLFSSGVLAGLAKLALVAAFVTAVWFFVLPAARHRRWSRDWKARYKLARHCPACQYNMQSLPAEPDGCTVCPECGGAWRLPAVV